LQVGEKDQIFGSVTAAEVTDAIEMQTGRQLDKKVSAPRFVVYRCLLPDLMSAEHRSVAGGFADVPTLIATTLGLRLAVPCSA
jgi:hypothetical protein